MKDGEGSFNYGGLKLNESAAKTSCFKCSQRGEQTGARCDKVRVKA